MFCYKTYSQQMAFQRISIFVNATKHDTILCVRLCEVFLRVPIDTKPILWKMLEPWTRFANIKMNREIIIGGVIFARENVSDFRWLNAPITCHCHEKVCCIEMGRRTHNTYDGVLRQKVGPQTIEGGTCSVYLDNRSSTPRCESPWHQWAPTLHCSRSWTDLLGYPASRRQPANDPLNLTQCHWKSVSAIQRQFVQYKNTFVFFCD